MHGQSDSWESFSFGTSRAHGALGKGYNIETSAVQKAKILNVHSKAKAKNWIEHSSKSKAKARGQKICLGDRSSRLRGRAQKTAKGPKQLKCNWIPLQMRKMQVTANLYRQR